MLKKILIAGSAVIVLFLVIVALQPSDFRVERSAIMAAPAPAVFAQVNDLHKWNAWSPWAKLDPAAKNTFSGAESGTGAAFTWSGNDQIGEGTMTITDSKPNELVAMRLDFVKPFAGSNTAEFAFKPDGEKTMVTWSMSGKKNFISKAVCMFMNMDKMLGGEFEKGLASLKTVVETKPKP